MLETIITTVMSYIGTNIDDIFIDTIFFSQVNTMREIRAVILGKYLGIGSLVLLSLLGAYGLQFIPQNYIGLLGLIPIALGIKEWISYKRGEGQDEENSYETGSDSVKSLILNVILVTMANGADNIGVYVPLFAGYTAAQMLLVLSIFALMIALWCFLSRKLANLPALRAFLLKYKQLIVPIVFISLGIYIIAANG